jgi:hypothetical protein
MKILLCATVCMLAIPHLSVAVFDHDLDEMKNQGVICHLGLPYANFATGSGDQYVCDLF